MPVRFEFQDKATRVQAEKTLRKVCKVSCAVPYPKRLRTLLDTLIVEGKKKCPNVFICTQVNVDNLTIEAHAKTAEGWLDLGLKQDIPLNICDINSTEVSLTSGSPQEEVMNIS
jgi:hypothetical protein